MKDISISIQIIVVRFGHRSYYMKWNVSELPKRQREIVLARSSSTYLQLVAIRRELKCLSIDE